MSTSANIDSIGNNGPCPVLKRYVFATSAGTATVRLEVLSADGGTLAQASVSVTSTPTNVRQLLEAVPVTWNDLMVGARLTEVATVAVYWNTSGVDTSVDSDGYTTAPSTTISGFIAVGDYRSDPYKLGVCN